LEFCSSLGQFSLQDDSESEPRKNTKVLFLSAQEDQPLHPHPNDYTCHRIVCVAERCRNPSIIGYEVLDHLYQQAVKVRGIIHGFTP